MNQEAQRFSELSQSYGTNWTRTNVGTLFEWVNIAAFNIRCLEICILRYRMWIRNQMILNLILSTTTGTISISQFGISGSQTIDIIIKILITIFTFLIALTAGALKVYQVQERLEEAIRLKQQWAAFSTGISSELQLPIELRIDGLWIIEKNKKTYLDLLNIDVDVPEHIKSKVIKELPHSANISFDGMNLSHILINICDSELTDMQSANKRNKDKFSTRPPKSTVINQAVPERIQMTVEMSRGESMATSTLPPTLPASPALSD